MLDDILQSSKYNEAKEKINALIRSFDRRLRDRKLNLSEFGDTGVHSSSSGIQSQQLRESYDNVEPAAGGRLEPPVG